MSQTLIDAKAISKAYKIYEHPRGRLMEAIWRGRRKYHREFWALRGVTFQVESGSTVGIIGMNGSGKSTLLQVIAGIVEPTSGDLSVQGRVASLLELGSGFNPEFTGRENILMNGAIIGFSPEETLELLPSIEDFAEIGDFIDQPVKTYSTGMLVRIAFAAAIHVDPDILLVDEALAVGDAVFQHRCIRRIQELQERGKTILFVSHDIGTVKAICTSAIFLHAGEIKAIGDPAEVANRYHAHIASLEARRTKSSLSPPASQKPDGPVVFRPDPSLDQRSRLFRYGTGAARVRNVEILDSYHRFLPAVEFDQEIIVRLHAEFKEDVKFCVVGYFIRDKNGIEVVGANTYEEGVPFPSLKATETVVVDFKQRLPLHAGTYSITSAIAHSRNSPTYLDWLDNALIFEVLPPQKGKIIQSQVWLPVEVTVHA